MHCLELLSVEINADALKGFFEAQFNKGISLAQILPLIEKDTVKKIAEMSAGSEKSEQAYLKIKKMSAETLKWIEYLVEARKSLSPEEKGALEKIQAALGQILEKWEPVIAHIVQKREERSRDLPRILTQTIADMEKETAERAKRILLGYENVGKEKFALVEKELAAFFARLKSAQEKILAYIQPKLPRWNEEVLHSGKGFFIDSTAELPCSLLFSVSGNCYLLFQTVGHLLGRGQDKVVLRVLSLPTGKINALIQPLFKEEEKEKQFSDMWMETELLLPLKGKRGIIDLEERMAYEIAGEKKLFLIEEYYWDGNIADYLRYVIEKKIAAAEFSLEQRKKIFTDLLQGLHTIHRKKIVHHDIKPDNILIDLRGGIKACLADFHLAIGIGDRQRVGTLKCVPLWAPPEYAKIPLHFERSVDALLDDYVAITTEKFDIWSLGVVFYCIAASEYPFWIADELRQPESEEKLYNKLVGLKRGWLPEHIRALPFSPLLEQMLDPDPVARCTAAQALDTLRELG